VDGQFVVDTAYPAILKDKLEKAVLAEKKEIVVKIRD
jgi:N-acetylmuramoyl-L-alanine amidase